MKASDIEIGRVYYDGKLGLRRVVDEGEHCNRYDAPPGTDCVAYEVLHARLQDPRAHHASTRANFGLWAKGRVPKDQEEEAQRVLRSASLFKTLSSPQRALLLRLHEAQAGQPHAQLLTAREMRSVHDLVDKGVLLSPSGSTYARLAPMGEMLVRRLHGETFEVPLETPPAPRIRFRRSPKP